MARPNPPHHSPSELSGGYTKRGEGGSHKGEKHVNFKLILGDWCRLGGSEPLMEYSINFLSFEIIP